MSFDRVNMGCGSTPTQGWLNFDNSPSIKLSQNPVLLALAKALKLLNAAQLENISWLQNNKIQFADATRKIPLDDNRVEVLYTSHMLEHLSLDGRETFLKEARRVLIPGGCLRIAVPDLEYHIRVYQDNEDADKFMRDILVTAPALKGWRNKLKVLVTGYRHHQWMYNGKSLSQLLVKHGFKDITIQPSGQTMIKNPGALNLKERAHNSVIVEAINP